MPTVLKRLAECHTGTQTKTVINLRYYTTVQNSFKRQCVYKKT